MSYFAADVKCPYYGHDNIKESTITCEGVLPGSTIKHHFGGKAVLTRQIKERCAADYETCPWYRLVSMKWEWSEK
jgi:hypothetical protein